MSQTLQWDDFYHESFVTFLSFLLVLLKSLIRKKKITTSKARKIEKIYHGP